MPIYEYYCSKCKNISEHILKMSDPDPDSCPECGSQNTLSKKLSQTSFVLKGSGWYETDFKGKPKDKPSTEETKSDKPQTPEKPPADKSEKPAKKEDKKGDT